MSQELVLPSLFFLACAGQHRSMAQPQQLGFIFMMLAAAAFGGLLPLAVVVVVTLAARVVAWVSGSIVDSGSSGRRVCQAEVVSNRVTTYLHH